MLFGNKIRALRDEQGVLQRQLAAYLEIDTPMFSKIERGDRRAKRSQVTMLAEYFHVDKKEMLTLWLADKILDALEGEEELGLCAILEDTTNLSPKTDASLYNGQPTDTGSSCPSAGLTSRTPSISDDLKSGVLVE